MCAPLHELDLSLKGLDGARDGECLGAILARCSELTDLNLSRNPMLSARGVAALVSSGCLGPRGSLARREARADAVSGL